MCEAVVPDGNPVDVVGSNPLNDSVTCIVLAVVSSTTVAFPVPGNRWEATQAPH